MADGNPAPIVALTEGCAKHRVRALDKALSDPFETENANRLNNDSTIRALEAARVSKAWPFEEARKIVDRLEKEGETGRTVLFETGYGPSGLPHIGTSAKWRAPPWSAAPSRYWHPACRRA